MSKGSKFKSFFAPLAAMGALAGIVQDLFIPLVKLGLWAGLIFIGIAFLLSFGPDKSNLGVKIREKYPHWKWGVVASTLVLGLFVLAASEVSTTFGKKVVVTAQSENIREEIENGKDVDDFEQRSAGILAKYLNDLTSFQSAVASINDRQLKTLEEVKEIKASIASMHKDVKDIKKTTEDTNLVVKDTNKVAKDTNKVVKDTNTVAKATKKDTEELLVRTEKTAYELLNAKGFQNDTTSFLRALRILNGQKLKEVLTLFHTVGYDPLEKHTNWQTVASVGFSEGLTDTMAAELMSAPASLTTFSLLSASDIGVEKIIQVSEAFDISLDTVTDPTTNTYAHKLNNGLMMTIKGHPNPVAARGHHYLSLISYHQEFTNSVSDNIGQWTLLHTAAYFGKFDNVAPLIKAGIDPNQRTIAGHTPLSLAFENYYAKDRDDISSTVTVLIEQGAEINAHKQVALVTAAMSGLLALGYSETQFRKLSDGSITAMPVSRTQTYEASKLGVYDAMVQLKRASSGLTREAVEYVRTATAVALEKAYSSDSQRKMAQDFIKVAIR